MAASDVRLRLPAGWTFAGLVAGLVLGALLGNSRAAGPVLSVAEPVGTVWIRALQMTILPLIAALLVTGIASMVETARAGAMARRTLLTFYALLAAGTVFAALTVPPLLAAFPAPAAAGAALAGGAAEVQQIPSIGAFFETLVARNVFAAAAEDAILPVIGFFAALAVAITRLPEQERSLLLGFFTALGTAMLILVGWILALAPLGVFALALSVAAQAGGAGIAALGHYILLVSAVGLAVLIAAYAVAVLAARVPLTRFARAALPAQAVAISTQSSLASLPAMLASCRRLKVRESTADFVLPLAVAIFRATSPAMNLAVAIYVAHISGVPLSFGNLTAGVLVALVTTTGSVGLPGAISFVASIGPIALAMGVPVAPLGLLVAVEMLPDLMRTVGNVTMNVAVTAALDRKAGQEG
ncbi:dicarboxylate/amino acid:cation symporter [Altericroceibacterium xinjiangense]|uniref:dicarboxylate/amino acid:cation symporter n=1 Tax=Altericroceibacterium xinjiangense TaxID=762261 RepID=UPI001F49CA66|nr:cation:dicarboxylase symporter family transporter [Altericroceibacterium xinjiangense]